MVWVNIKMTMSCSILQVSMTMIMMMTWVLEEAWAEEEEEEVSRMYFSVLS